MTNHPQSQMPRAWHGRHGPKSGFGPTVLLAAALALTACFEEREVRVVEQPIPPRGEIESDVATQQPTAEPPVPDRKPVLEVAGVVERPQGIEPPASENEGAKPSIVLALSGLSASTKVENLLDKDFADVVALLGDPSSKQLQSPGEMWLFAAEGNDCTLRLFFYPQVESESFRVLSYEAVGADGGYAAQECLDILMAERRESDDEGQDGVGPTGSVEMMQIRNT